ncbi:MAG: HAD family phosphatase [Planctomycetes bacterium]|nr:HAD family phosphatase [Planctomycetota bacterium]
MFASFCRRELGREFAAAIFDCDGVLVDSEPLANRVMAELLAEHGIPLTPEECARTFVGLTVDGEAALIRREYGIDLAEVLHRELTPRTLTCFATELQATPGVEAFVRAVDVPRAVASNSRMQRVERSLEITGLRRLFDGKLFSASHVARPKPAPDLYQHVAVTLGVPAADCVVFEDSASGCTAARAAGMTAVGYLGGGHVRPGHGERLLKAGAMAILERWPVEGTALGL